MQPLVDKYAPKTIDEVRGQKEAVQQLESFNNFPSSKAFIFAGDTGTGKTTCARLLAQGLGVKVDEQELGGMFSIASGEQTGETVRERMRALHSRPFFGSGWKVLVVNEADHMSTTAAMIWLDALENMPHNTVIIFTTNHIRKLQARLRDRCEIVYFEARAMFLQEEARALVQEIWVKEGCQGAPPSLDDLGVIDEQGNLSFRRVLQLLDPCVRRRVNGKSTESRRKPAPPAPAPDLRSRLKAMRERVAAAAV